VNATSKLHADWIGMLQPDGLVVSIRVLDELDLYVRQPQDKVVAWRDATPDDALPDLETLAAWLDWPEAALQEPPAGVRLDLPDLRATVAPTHVLRDRAGRPALWVAWTRQSLDKPPPGEVWPASPTERLERLLARATPPVGLLVGPEHIRLTYAPPGEAPGRLTFRVSELRTTDGRLLLDALYMLLGAPRVYNPPSGLSLAEVLRASRSRQEQVTERLAIQVQGALAALLAGFDEADERTRGALSRGLSADELYDGLSVMLLRLVFLLYAEDRGLMPVDNPIYEEGYSVAGLGAQLAQDRAALGEALGRRFGAWARLLSLTRMVFDGAHHADLALPPRRGDLFDPDRHPFLEGRAAGSRYTTDPPYVPPIDDAVVDQVLQSLLHLEGQRISYRNLEVEQLGSVYEALMGWEVVRAATPAVRLRGGAWVEVGALAEADQPCLRLQDITGERNAKIRKELPLLDGFAPTGDPDVDRARVLTALDPWLDRKARPLPAGRHYLQGGAERRNTGSHYTPRSLTEPLVARTLAPLLGDAPTPAKILGLRVCDPAMGSGAFLAEVVRQLADALVLAWARAGQLPPGQHDPLLVARRKVAEQCVYGVDKNPRAVQLARLSVWLITSAADLPFTFVDHNLKQGDALVGATLEQAASFAWVPDAQERLQTPAMKQAMGAALRLRGEITAEQRRLMFAVDEHKRQRSFLSLADDEVWDELRVGDLLVACAWDAPTAKEADKRRQRMLDLVWRWYPNPEKSPLPAPAAERVQTLPMRPFHWHFEFPEVFTGKQPGFDAVIGNPPFGGKNTILAENGAPYIKLLQVFWPHAHGNSDLAAYFFLRARQILKPGGWFSLVASNTIRQGNTLDTGLRHLVATGVTLVAADVDLPWPTGGAAVVVDRVTGVVGSFSGTRLRDGQPVAGLASDLSAGAEAIEAVPLRANANRCFIGSYVLGKGFVLEPDEAHALIARDPRNAEIVRPYLGGKELNSNVPPHPDAPVPHSRYVISFGDRDLEACRAWPELIERVERLVKPERDLNNREQYRNFWWWHAERRPGLYRTIAGLERCLVASIVTKHLLFGFQPVDVVFSHKLSVFAMQSWFEFAVLQSQMHSHFAWSQSSTMKTDLNYTPSRCFETFPFPRPDGAGAARVAAAGQALYRARAERMVAEQVGMTEVWNQVHDPHVRDPEIVALRALRLEMDRAVLAAYGWADLDPDDAVGAVARLRGLNAERARGEGGRG
jgi:hypothetical protein